MFENTTGGKGEDKLNNEVRLKLKFRKDNLEDTKPARKKKIVEENSIKKYFKPSNTTRLELRNLCQANGKPAIRTPEGTITNGASFKLHVKP